MSSLRFSRSLYRMDAVEKAAESFAACGTFAVQTRGEDIVVELTDLHPGLSDRLETLLDEFRNHALFATILAERGDGTGGA